MSSKEPKLIAVDFIDAANGDILFTTEISPDQLPQSFEAKTTLHLGDDDWRVENAEPMTAPEFTATGKLRLTLSRVPPAQTMDPNNILYSLPTICDVIPAATQTKSQGPSWLPIHEDDWRQIEFISAVFETEIDQMLGSIQKIYDAHQPGHGFKELYVRSDISQPLDGVTITLEEIAALGFEFGSGVTYSDGSVIQDGFVATAGGLILFGTAPVQQLTTLCASRISEAVTPESVQALVNFAQSKSLYLVDWCRVLRLSPDQLPQYFAANSEKS